MQAPLMGAPNGDGTTGGAKSPGVWDLVGALTVVDLVCYFLHKHEVSEYPPQQHTRSDTFIVRAVYVLVYLVPGLASVEGHSLEFRALPGLL